MVVGWSEVEGGELATREGTRSGVPPLKHMPRFLAPVSQRLPHHQHDHHSGQIHQKLSAKLNHNDNVSLASQPCRRHHRPTICDRNRLPSPTTPSSPLLSSPTECRQQREPRRRRRPQRHELPLAVDVVRSLDTAGDRATTIRQLAPLVRRQYGRAGGEHRRKWPGHRRPAPDRGGDCKDQAIRGWPPPHGQIKCWLVLTMFPPGLHHDWYGDRFSRSHSHRGHLFTEPY